MSSKARLAEFKLDDTKTCLSESMFTAHWSRWINKQPHADLMIHDWGDDNNFVRRCWLLSLEGERYWADRVTGTLYRDRDGQCMSTSRRIATIPPETRKWVAPEAGYRTYSH